jgi:hypothetical protein
VNHDDAWFERQLARCNSVLRHTDKTHTEHEREAARKQLEEYERKGRRPAPQQHELTLAA